MAFLSSYDGELREPLVLSQGSPVSIRVARGSVGLLLSHGRGIGPQFALKRESGRLSRVVAGNPGFPRLVTVTSGSFSWCLWEVRNTLEWELPLGTPMGSCNGRGPHLELRREPKVSSPVLTWVSDVYAISNRESGLNLCGGMELCFPLELSKGFQVSSRVEFGTWGSFQTSILGIRTPFVL